MVARVSLVRGKYTRGSGAFRGPSGGPKFFATRTMATLASMARASKEHETEPLLPPLDGMMHEPGRTNALSCAISKAQNAIKRMNSTIHLFSRGVATHCEEFPNYTRTRKEGQSAPGWDPRVGMRSLSACQLMRWWYGKWHCVREALSTKHATCELMIALECNEIPD